MVYDFVVLCFFPPLVLILCFLCSEYAMAAMSALTVCAESSIHDATRQTTSSFISPDVEMIKNSFELNKMMLLNYDESS